MTQQLLKRSDVKKDLTWDLSRIFKSDAEFETTLKEFVNSVDDFLKLYKDKMETVDILIKALEDYDRGFSKIKSSSINYFPGKC